MRGHLESLWGKIKEKHFSWTLVLGAQWMQGIVWFILKMLTKESLWLPKAGFKVKGKVEVLRCVLHGGHFVGTFFFLTLHCHQQPSVSALAAHSVTWGVWKPLLPSAHPQRLWTSWSGWWPGHQDIWNLWLKASHGDSSVQIRLRTPAWSGNIYFLLKTMEWKASVWKQLGKQVAWYNQVPVPWQCPLPVTPLLMILEPSWFSAITQALPAARTVPDYCQHIHAD